MADIPLNMFVQFTKNKVGVNSLTVTWDVEQITRADGTRAALASGAANNIVFGRRGLYGYHFTGDPLAYDYIATAITAGDVDRQEISGIRTDWAEAHASQLALLDAAITSRAAAAYYTPARAAKLDYLTSAPLTGAQTAAAVLDALDEDHDTPGTIGHDIGIAGGLGGAVVETISPVTASGQVTTHQGHRYQISMGNPIRWVKGAAQWPSDLTGSTILVKVAGQTFTGYIETATGDNQTVGVELTHADTISIDDKPWSYWVWYTKTGEEPFLLATGVWISMDTVYPEVT